MFHHDITTSITTSITLIQTTCTLFHSGFHTISTLPEQVIILERNRRVAKAYARAPILTINGSEDGFDGFKIGVNGFDNPLRDYKVILLIIFTINTISKVKEFKAQIGAGCKLKMGDNGDILVKRVGKGNIYIKNILEETAVSNEILKLPNGLLELDRALKLFDMKKFKQNMNREMKRQYPDRSKIETQCVSTLAFVKNEAEVLDSPIWIIIVNIVALEMLGDRMPKLGGGGQEIILPFLQFIKPDKLNSGLLYWHAVVTPSARTSEEEGE